MRRFGRILLNVATGVSLLLCVGTVALWVRSYTYFENRTYWTALTARGNSGYSAYSGYGRVGLGVDEYTVPAAGHDAYIRRGSSGRVPPYTYEWTVAYAEQPQMLGSARANARPFHFQFESEELRDLWNIPGLRCRRRLIVTPYWAPAVAFALAPAARLAVWFRRRYVRAHSSGVLCPACGYDVRATPERCPECGHSASS